MRLDFRVLWIDDQPDRVKSAEIQIARNLVSEGFEFQPQIVTSLDEAQPFLGDSVFCDEVDLVLVDYDLGRKGGKIGDRILKLVRDALQYRDIIFYSALTPAELKRLVFDQDVQGVYCTHRDYLSDTVKGVFRSIVKKVVDINHMRGIVMGATSDVDVAVIDCLLKIYKTLDVSGKEELLKDVHGRIKELADESEKRFKSALAVKDAQTLLSSKHPLTAFHKTRLLLHLLKQGDHQHLSTECENLKKYLGEVVPMRNTLGHARLAPAENGSRVFHGFDGKTVSEDEMLELRKALLSHRGMFARLLKGLSSED